MSETTVAVLHLVASDTWPEAWDIIRALRGLAGGGLVHSVVRLTQAPAVLAGVRARRAVERDAARHNGPVVLHAWSRTAAERCLPMAATHRPLVVHAEAAGKPGRVASWARTGTVALVCQSKAQRNTLIRAGAPEARCALIRPGVASDVPCSPEERSRLRAQLGLGEHDVVVAALPSWAGKRPAPPRSSAFIAAWAALLLEKVRPDVRLILPRDGCEAERAWRLVAAGQHERVARIVAPARGLRDCLAACDLAAYLPASHASLDSLAVAMASGRPIVASSTLAIREVLADGDTAWLCRPDDPRDAARCMLQALENPAQSGRHAEQAREQARTLFSLPRMLDDYRRMYQNLAARRPAVCCDQ
jgi:hypothetical protein